MSRLLGDFNNDNVVDNNDATALLRYLDQASMCRPIDPVRTSDDLDAGDVMRNGVLSSQDSWAIQKYYSFNSTTVRVYPKTQPANWTDTGADGYKKYFYINEQGQEVSLANEPTAPTFIAKKYYYKNIGVTDILGDDALAALVTHLP